MSTLEDATRELNITRYFALVAFAILYYDYVLTVSLEYQRYWFIGRFTWATFLFFVVRYLAVLGHIPVILNVFAREDADMCSAMLLFHQIFAVVIQVFVGILLIVRTYALYNRNRWVLGVTVSVAVAGVTVAGWSILKPHELAPPLPVTAGCSTNLSQSQGTYFAIAWSSMLLFDVLIFGLTVFRAVTLSRTVRRTLFDILLRDGSMYFACMGGANLANILTFVFCPPSLKGVPTIFTNVVSTTLISRLMLNIRDPKVLSQSQNLTSTTTNSGAPLTRTGDLPFISTIFPVAGDTSVPVVDYYENPDDRVHGTTESDDFELVPLRKDKRPG